MGERPESTEAIIFYLYKNVEELKKDIKGMQSSMQQLHTDLAVLAKDKGDDQKDRLKANAAGGGMGALLAGVIMALWEYMKKG